MRIRNIASLLLMLFVLAALAPAPAQAQIWKKVKERAKKAAEDAVGDEVEERTRRGVEGAFDVAEDAVRCAVTDEVCIEKASEEGKDVIVVDEEGEVVRTVKNSPGAGAEAEAQAAPMVPGEGVWANYDFVPGERVLLFEDFGDAYVGDFPRRFEFVSGNAEIVEWEGQRLLRINDRGAFTVPLSETLPERFTIEFDFHNPNRHAHLYVTTSQAEVAIDKYTYPYHRFIVSPEAGGVGVRAGKSVEGKPSSAQQNRDFMEQVVPIRITVDGSYAKMYVGEKRVANLPNADFNHTDRLEFWYGGFGGPAYVGNLRIAAGGRQMMYEQLQADGEVTTHGILFDTGSSAIRPESTPTLKDMARMLDQHTDLRLRIEGHTDDTGSAETNQQLSQKRAEAVKQYLVEKAGIDGARLEAVGKGPAEPIADNATPEGRQTNRRVELVKL